MRYAWSLATDETRRKFVAGLGGGPVRDAVTAVRASIVAETRGEFLRARRSSTESSATPERLHRLLACHRSSITQNLTIPFGSHRTLAKLPLSWSSLPTGRRTLRRLYVPVGTTAGRASAVLERSEYMPALTAPQLHDQLVRGDEHGVGAPEIVAQLAVSTQKISKARTRYSWDVL
jgi:hypothetical protein